MITKQTTFTVHRDVDYDFIVADASIGATSFALVPADKAWNFTTEAEARAQAKALSGQVVNLRCLETPDRFEAVADTKYGPAWE